MDINNSLLSLAIVCLLLTACGGGSSSGGGSGSSSSPSSSSSSGISAPPQSCNANCIRINEAVSSNQDLLDNDDDTPDWFELYNWGDSTINLDSWTITDDPNTPDKWRFPNLNLAAGDYILIWASDKDYVDLANGALHTNFKLASEPGETLYLYDTQGKLIDSLDVIGIPSGYSAGVSSSNDNALFVSPSPGLENSGAGYAGVITGQVMFSHEGGQTAPLTLTLSGAAANEDIRYTRNGAEPTTSSPRFPTNGLSINNDTVIRAKIFRDNYYPSPIFNRTYIVDKRHSLPVVTLTTAPDNFFDEVSGIHSYGSDFENTLPYYGANFWEDWETEIHFAFYDEHNTLGVALNAGVKIFGGWSRANDQRSLAIFARDRYGAGKINYPLFPELDYQKFEAVVLRNGGNDWNRSFIRDAMMTQLMSGTGIETQAYQPVAAYLNGDYWGMYNLREKINEHFVASKSGFDTDQIDLLESEGSVIHGDNSDYLALIQFIRNNNLTDESNFQVVAEQMDIDNFTIYTIANIYFNNTDWPGNNIKFWRGAGEKWRWIMYDTDFGFGIYDKSDYTDDTLDFALEAGGTGWPNPDWSTLLLRRLMTNQGFRENFINRFADELNTRFQSPAIASRIDSMTAYIQSEIPQHQARWNAWVNWQDEINEMKFWASQRSDYVWTHIADQFALGARNTLTLHNNDPARGSIRLNHLNIDSANWHGDYFDGIPITLEALPAPGYVFDNWNGDVDQSDSIIHINVSDDTNIEAIFVPE